MREVIIKAAGMLVLVALGCGNSGTGSSTTNTGNGGTDGTSTTGKPTKFPNGGTWAFVTSFENGPAVVLATKSDAAHPGAVDGWSFGSARYVTDDGIFVVEIDVNEKALPQQFQGWSGWQVSLLSSTGEPCSATLDRPELLAVVDLGDEHAGAFLSNVIEGADENDVPALVWKFDGAERHLTMAITEQQAEACKYTVGWAIPAGRELGEVSEASSAAPAIEAEATKLFRGLQEYWDVQRDFQKIEGNDPTPVIPDPDATPDDFIGWWHEWDQFGSLEVDSVKVGDGEMYVLASGRAGDGCCSNSYSLDVLWRVKDGAWTQLAAEPGLFFGYRLVAAVDVDGDGSRDLMFEGTLGMLGVWFQTDDAFKDTEFLSTARSACNPNACMGF